MGEDNWKFTSLHAYPVSSEKSTSDMEERKPTESMINKIRYAESSLGYPLFDYTTMTWETAMRILDLIDGITKKEIEWKRAKLEAREEIDKLTKRN